MATYSPYARPDIDFQIPQLKKKISGVLSRTDSQKSQRSQKSPEPRQQHHRKPSFQNGQPVPREHIHHLVGEENLVAPGIGSRARSGEYCDLLDGVAIAEAAHREKQRRTGRPRSASLDTDAGGYVVVPPPAYAYPATPRTPYDGRPRAPPSQPVPDSVLPGQTMRESVSSIVFPGVASTASVYSQVSTVAPLPHEIAELGHKMKHLKLEKGASSRESQDSRGFVSPYEVSVHRKGAIKRNLSSGSINHEMQASYTKPALVRKDSRMFSVNPVEDFGRYPRIASGHSRETLVSSVNVASSSRTSVEHVAMARPPVYHSSTVPTKLPSSRSAAPPPQPIRWPTASPEEPKSWYTPRREDVPVASSIRNTRMQDRMEGPPPTSSSGSSGYLRNERSTHKLVKTESSSSLWLDRTPRSSDALADGLLGGKPRRDRYDSHKLLATPTPPATSSHHSVHRSSSRHYAPPHPRPDAPRASSARTPHRPTPLVTAFGSIQRSNTYASTTSSPSSFCPPTPPPLPTSTLRDPLQRHAAPLPLSETSAARRALRQEHAASAVSIAAEVGRGEWHESYRLGEDNIRRRRESEYERRRAKERERERVFF